LDHSPPGRGDNAGGFFSAGVDGIEKVQRDVTVTSSALPHRFRTKSKQSKHACAEYCRDVTMTSLEIIAHPRLRWRQRRTVVDCDSVAASLAAAHPAIARPETEAPSCCSRSTHPRLRRGFLPAEIRICLRYDARFTTVNGVLCECNNKLCTVINAFIS